MITPTRIDGVRLVTADLSRLARFYSETLGFVADGAARPIGPDEMTVLGLSGHGRRQSFRVGDQTLAIDEFEIAGAPYPMQTDAASLSFQHFALVVTDIRSAHARVADATAISIGGPQQLPESSGGVTAYKFRDPDGHPLEFLQFPADAIPKRWNDRVAGSGHIAVGLDHSAIAVSDLARSQEFYGTLGLVETARTRNMGRAQRQLDGLAQAEVDVVAMGLHDDPPHIELLAYDVSRGRQPGIHQANDVAATRIVWQGPEPVLFADPDNHLHQIRPF